MAEEVAVHLVGEQAVAGDLELGEVVRAELERAGGDGVVELPDAGRTDDRRRQAGAREQPGEGDLGARPAVPLGDPADAR